QARPRAADVCPPPAAPLDRYCCLPPADALTSAAPGELALLVLEHERGELAQRVVDVALVHDPIGRELGVAHLALEEPSLHVEHALDIDSAVRAAGGPRIFVQQFRARFGAGADREIDQRRPPRAAALGLALIAATAHIRH